MTPRCSQRLTFVQEFSIEIPDKEADSILSSTFHTMERSVIGTSLLLIYYSRQGSRLYFRPTGW